MLTMLITLLKKAPVVYIIYEEFCHQKEHLYAEVITYININAGVYIIFMLYSLKLCCRYIIIIKLIHF